MTSRLGLFAALCILAPMVAACSGPPAPSEPGVCWRAQAGADGKPGFAPMAREVTSLENCAVLLEAARLMGQTPTDGAYQGSYIFVDAHQIGASTHRAGYHYPILQPPQRQEVDKDLKQMIKDRGGKLPSAADLELERQ